jgi:hypothetical protein
MLSLGAAWGCIPLLHSAQAAPPSKTVHARPAARRTGGASLASRPTQKAGAFTWTANEVTGEPMGNGWRFALNGNVRFVGPDRTITSHEMTIDLPAKAKDITAASATGSVEMTARLPDGRNLMAKGQSLVYDHVNEKITLDRSVYIRSDLQGGGTVEATGQHALVTSGAQGRFQEATLSGGVNMTLLKPGTFEGPATSSGQTLTLNLLTGKWTLGGGTKGSFNLSPQPGNH